MKTKKLWVRLGGFIEFDEDAQGALFNGDESALLDALKKYGFTVNGECYIPYSSSHELEDDVTFEMDSVHLDTLIS